MPSNIARLVLTVSALAVATAAQAQPQVDQVEADVPAADAAEENSIVVTGSRIFRPELANPMPVSVVDMEQAEQLGLVTAWSALIREPSISPGVGRANAGACWRRRETPAAQGLCPSRPDAHG